MGAPTAQPQQKWIDRPQEPLNADSWALHEGRQGEVVEPVVEEIQGHARPGQNIQQMETPGTPDIERQHFPEVQAGNG